MKNKLLIALFIGLILLLNSCDSANYSINDIEYDLLNYYEYSLSNNNDFHSLNLKYNYPKLSIGVEIEDDDINLEKMSLIDINNSFHWDFIPTIISFNNINYYGYDNINLASYDYREGKYLLNIISDKGKELSTEISIKNPFTKIKEYSIYYYFDRIIISNEENKNYKDFEFNSIISTLKKIEISFYDYSNNVIETTTMDNYFEKENYPFMIESDNFDNIKYVKIVFLDKLNIKNCIIINLSSSNSFH